MEGRNSLPRLLIAHDNSYPISFPEPTFPAPLDKGNAGSGIEIDFCGEAVGTCVDEIMNSTSAFPRNVNRAAMARSKCFFDDVKKELECSVCQEQFSEINAPKILKCLHTFCKTCLEAWIRQHREGELSCPTCRRITECPNSDTNRLPSNLFYKQMLEIVEAYSGQGQEDSSQCGNCEQKASLKYYCSDCNCFLCEHCAETHKKWKRFKEHHIKEIGSFDSSDVQDYARKANVCKKHKDELRYYCDKCKICICRDCAILEHQDHNKISFEQGLEKKKSEISKRMQEVETVGILLKQQKESLQKRGTRVNNSIDQATDEAHRFAEHCITLIRNHEATIIKELLNHKASFSSEFSSQMSSLDEKVKDVNSSLEFGKDILERNNLPEILNVEETLERRFQDFLTSPEFSRCIVMDNCGVKYEPRDMSNIEKELGKLSFSNTDPSLSIAQGKGLTEGLQGEDCTFTIVTKDWQGQTTYNETDLVNVDIQSMRTGKVIKSIITDVKDGCYEVKFRPEDAGEFRVSITVVGETIKGSPFHLKVLETNKNASSLKKKEKKEFKRERKSGQRGSESLSMIDPSRFDVPAQFMKLLKQVYKTNLQHIEETFNVYIVWEDSASQVCIHPSQTARGKTLYQDGCNAFIDLYQGFHPNVRREVVELPEEANESLIHDAICSLQAEHPVIVEKVENSLVVYAEKEAITRSLRALKKKLSLKQNSGTQKLKRGEENFSRDACEYNEVQQHVRLPFSPQHLNQVLKNGVNLSLYQGDITNEQVDAIVNPANEWLQHGAGVAAAIVRKGGQTIQDESDWLTSKNGPLAVGTATITNSGNLPCRHVIHTVGPRWREHGREKSISLLRQACLESLLIAVKLNFSSIAFTAISSGIFGMPKEICAQVMFDVAEEFSASDDAEFNTLRDVRFVIIDEPTIRSFCEEFDKRFPS